MAEGDTVRRGFRKQVTVACMIVLMSFAATAASGGPVGDPLDLPSWHEILGLPALNTEPPTLDLPALDLAFQEEMIRQEIERVRRRSTHIFLETVRELIERRERRHLAPKGQVPDQEPEGPEEGVFFLKPGFDEPGLLPPEAPPPPDTSPPHEPLFDQIEFPFAPRPMIPSLICGPKTPDDRCEEPTDIFELLFDPGKQPTGPDISAPPEYHGHRSATIDVGLAGGDGTRSIERRSGPGTRSELRLKSQDVPRSITSSFNKKKERADQKDVVKKLKGASVERGKWAR